MNEHALDTHQPGVQKFVRLRLDPGRDVQIGGTAVRRIVLESAIFRRVVRGRDHNAVRESGLPSLL